MRWQLSFVIIVLLRGCLVAACGVLTRIRGGDCLTYVGLLVNYFYLGGWTNSYPAFNGNNQRETSATLFDVYSSAWAQVNEI